MGACPSQPDCQIASGNGGSRALTSQLRAGNAAIHTTYPVFQVVDLRIELSAPRLSAEDGQPALDYLFIPSSSYGNRTHLSSLKGRNPKPLNERAVLFQSTKKARRLVTPGFLSPVGIYQPGHQRSGCAEQFTVLITALPSQSRRGQ